MANKPAKNSKVQIPAGGRIGPKTKPGYPPPDQIAADVHAEVGRRFNTPPDRVAEIHKALGGNLAKRALQQALTEVFASETRWRGFFLILRGKASDLIKRIPEPYLTDKEKFTAVNAVEDFAELATQRTAAFAAEVLKPFTEG